MELEIDKLWINLYNFYLDKNGECYEDNSVPYYLWDYTEESVNEAEQYANDNIHKAVSNSELFSECETNDDVAELDLKVKKYINENYGG